MIRYLRRLSANGLVGDAAVYIGASAMSALIPFLLLPLLARWLGPADFGVIGSFIAIANVLVMLVGLNSYGFASVAYFRDGPQALSEAVAAAVTIILIASVLVGVGGWIAQSAVERFTEIDRAWLWTLLAAATGQALIAVGLAVAQTIRRPPVYGAIQIGYGLVLAIFAILFVGGFDMGWPGRALAQGAAAVLISAAVLGWLKRTGRLTLFAGRTMLARALSFGISLLPHSFAAVAMVSMDRIILAGRSSPEIVGQYFLALQIASVFAAFAAAVNQAWVPWLYERLARNEDRDWEEIIRTLSVGSALLLVGAALMAALATPLVLLVGGLPYMPAAAPLRILACYGAFQALYTLISAFLFYAERTRLLSGVTVTAAVVQGGLILVVGWGAVGVATALAASSIIALAILATVAYRIAVAHRSEGSSVVAPAAAD